MSGARTPDWLVERIALGELPAEELERARAQLLSEEDGAQRLAALERSNAEILAAHPVARISAAVTHRAKKPEAPGWWRLLWWAAPLAVSASVMMVVFTAEEQPTHRLKGQVPALVVHRQGPSGALPMASGDHARPGELLQLGYQRAGFPHGLLLSIDGAGVVTRHLPETGNRSAPLEGSGLTPLPHAYELDGAPEFERFFLVTAHTSFELAPVLEAAQKMARSPGRARVEPLPLPAGLEQSSLLILKVNR